MGFDHRREGLCPDQRHIAAENENVAGKIAERGLRAEHRVAGAELLFLSDPDYVISIISVAHGAGTMADDNGDPFRLKPLRGPQGVQEQGLSAERMEHFGKARFHPRTLPRGQKDDPKITQVPIPNSLTIEL